MKEALARMLPRRSGHIVNLASVAGKGGFPHLATYCATKHAVVGVSEAAYSEYRDSGIDVSCVMPALVDTELTSGVRAGRGIEKAKASDVADEIVDALRVPRFNVFVPRSVGRINKFMNILPRAAAEKIGQMLEADKLMAQANMTERKAYEDRAAASEPSAHLETAADQEKQPVA